LEWEVDGEEGTLEAMRVLVVAAMLWAVPAHANRELCERGARHHGATVDLDLKSADLHDVFRLLAEVGHVNVVVSDQVSGKTTMRLHQVAWDAAACAIAGVHHLTITVQDNVLLVVPTSAGAAGPRR
jgi:type II secretory pathway component HofQ